LNLSKFLNTKLLLSLVFFAYSYSIAEVKADNMQAVDDQKYIEPSDLEGIHEALSIFSGSNKQYNLIYEQKKREMLDSVEERFLACDSDNDQTLDVYETTQCLPQVARQFREVDTDNDNLITLDEMSILAKNYQQRSNQDSNSSRTKIVEEDKKNPAATLEGGNSVNTDNKSL